MQKRICYYIPPDAYFEDRGYRVSIVTEGEPGHIPTGEWPNDGTGVLPYFWGHDYEKACARADGQNAKMGISKKDSIAIIASSMGAQIREDRPAPEAKRRRNVPRFHVESGCNYGTDTLSDTEPKRTWLVKDRDNNDEKVAEFDFRIQAREEARQLNAKQ